MTDAFEGIDRLAEGAPRTDGAPNFRRLPGFPLFGTGQTSVEGFEKCLEPVLKKYGDEKHIFWVNLRQEPVVYVNGKLYTARDPAKVNFHLEVNNPEECTAMENDFAEEIKKRGEDFKYFKDQFGEHPEERASNEELEWERKIPDENLSELKDLLSAADFKANMPKIIKRIYELSWDMFGDLPRGHHKNNSMHKLASKTMIEILPDNLAAHVE